jgi:HK97 family phage major capsid protein
MKVLTVGNDTTGGYLAPPEMVMEIIKGVVEFTPFRSICTVYQTSRGELLLPKRTQTASATRVGEISARAETQNPAWSLMSIQTPEMYAQARISKQNLEDSAFQLDQFLIDEFREQFGVKEGAEAINGAGSPTQLLGILAANAGGIGSPLSFQVSGSAATIAGPAAAQADGLIDLFYGVKTAYAARGRWILNRNSLGKVRKLKDTTGQYLWAPPIGVGEPATLLGAPYTECPDMPNEGANAFPIGFGDWKRAYVIVDRIDIDVVRDDITLADVGQVKFTARRRVGGQPVLIEAVKLLKCST